MESIKVILAGFAQLVASVLGTICFLVFNAASFYFAATTELNPMTLTLISLSGYIQFSITANFLEKYLAQKVMKQYVDMFTELKKYKEKKDEENNSNPSDAS